MLRGLPVAPPLPAKEFARRMEQGDAVVAGVADVACTPGSMQASKRAGYNLEGQPAG